MTEVLVLIAIAALAALILGYRYNQAKGLRDQGKIVKRDMEFKNQSEHFFLQDAPFEKVAKLIEGMDLVDAKVKKRTVHPEERYIAFASSGEAAGTWNAVLELIDHTAEEYHYDFHFTRYGTYKRGAPLLTMNVLLTAIEKMFLSIDPQTKVTTKNLTVKSKRNIF